MREPTDEQLLAAFSAGVMYDNDLQVSLAGLRALWRASGGAELPAAPSDPVLGHRGLHEADELFFARVRAEPGWEEMFRIYDSSLIPLALSREVDPRRLRDVWNHGWETARKVLGRVYKSGREPWLLNQDRITKAELIEIAQTKSAETDGAMRLLGERFPLPEGMGYVVMANGKIAEIVVDSGEQDDGG